MSLSETALFVDQASVPALDPVVRQIADAGHAVGFPDGFHLTDGDHAFWLPLTLDGNESGFDYHVMPREAFIGDDADIAYPEHGDTVLSFVARGDQSSVLAAALVQRAICDLSDAQGWWPEGEEALSNTEMVAFLGGMIADIEADPAPPLAQPARNEPQRKSRLPQNYFRDIGKALLAGVLVIGAAALFIFGMAYFSGSGAGN